MCHKSCDQAAFQLQHCVHLATKCDEIEAVEKISSCNVPLHKTSDAIDTCSTSSAIINRRNPKTVIILHGLMCTKDHLLPKANSQKLSQLYYTKTLFWLDSPSSLDKNQFMHCTLFSEFIPEQQCCLSTGSSPLRGKYFEIICSWF